MHPINAATSREERFTALYDATYPDLLYALDILIAATRKARAE